MFNGAIRALGKAGVFGKRVTGIADGTDVETPERDAGCGQATHQRRIEDKRSKPAPSWMPYQCPRVRGG